MTDARSLDFLDWPDLLAALSERAHSSRGRARCLGLRLAATAAEARAGIALVTELVGLLREVELPGLAFPEVEPLLAAAEKGGVLGVAELTEVASVCEIAAATKRFFLTRGGAASGGGDAPGIASLAATLDPRDEIAHRVRATFDAAGEIRDSVSPALARLRREREQLSTRVREEVERLMTSAEFKPSLQDQFVTLRADRYVLPLKASAKSMGLGIVHDTSRSGETVFVEPTAVVGLNNRLKVAELEIRRESRAILEALTRRVAEAAATLRANLETLTALDVLAAKARLSIEFAGTAPEVVDACEILLRRARHPLLALRAATEGFEVVANDLALGGAERGAASAGAGARVLVVSGPNAGGKTVLLKTAGLAALLARAGMHVSAAPGSRVGLFDPVLADIGDQQTLAGGLSTFSAHLANVAAILADAAASKRPLVLVDELMVGTNPEQGAALARAVLERMADLPGLTITTTHYDGLKALAHDDPRFRNGSMEYDLHALRPTYRLRDGLPGRSYALDIAQRMGIPAAVLERATALAGGATVGLEEVIARLESRDAELARESDALSRARHEAETAAEAHREAAEALRAAERELSRHAREAVDEAVRETRDALKAIVRDAQAAGTARAAESARRAAEATAQAALAALPTDPVPPPGGVEPTAGSDVYVPSLRSNAVVSRARDARGRVKVAVGALSFDVDAAELEPPRGARARPAANPTSAGADTDADATDYTTPTAETTLDLRGLRADEAVAEVERFLDRCSLAGRSPVFVVHGYGTGALRKSVRDYLARSPYVRRWRPGSDRQGGDGVSVIDL